MIETRNTAVGTVVEPGADGRPAARRPPGLAARAAVGRRGDTGRRPHRQPAPVSLGGRHLGGRRHRQQHDLPGGRRASTTTRSTTSASRCRSPTRSQEFKVETGVRPARYGIYTGATVNAVTKAGTNSLHGNLFEFLRDHRFNAKNAFALADDGLNRAPDGRHVRRADQAEPPVLLRWPPGTRATGSGRAISRPSCRPRRCSPATSPQIASAACNNGTALTLPAPFVNNQVNPALFNPISMRIVDLLPVSTDPCGRITYARARQQRRAADRRPPRLAGDDRPAPVRPLLHRQLRSRPGYDGTNLLLVDRAAASASTTACRRCRSATTTCCRRTW